MDGFELNKIAGAILLAGVIAMLTGFVSRILIPEPHMEESIIVASGAEAEADSATAEAEPQSILPILASASVEEGQKVARKCAACHTFEQGGPNRVGPNLWNVVGAEKAHLDNYSYSTAMAEAEGEWTYEELDAFLANPRTALPGTKMAFAGLNRVEERADMIAYMRSLSDDPVPLPEAAAEAPAEQPAEEAAEAPAAADGAAADQQTEAAGSDQTGAQESQPQAQEGEAAPATEQPEQQQSETQQPETQTQGETEQAATDAPAAQPATPTEGTETPPTEQTTAQAEAPAEQPTEAPAEAAAEGSGSDDPLVAMIKAADPEEGAKVARKCVACHTFDKDASNRVGPNLWGVIGGPVAHRDDYRYSKAMEEHGGEWTYETLSAYLENPRTYMPGNKMTFAGLKKPEERAAIIAYMRTMADSPPPLD